MWDCIVRNTMSFSCRLLTLIYIANLFNNIFSPQLFKHMYTHTHTHTRTHTHMHTHAYFPIHTSLIKLRSITIIKCILFSYTVDSWKAWVWTMQTHLYTFLFSINTTSLQSLSWLNPWMQNQIQKANYKVLHGFLTVQCGNGVWAVFRNSTLLKGLLYIHKFL